MSPSFPILTHEFYLAALPILILSVGAILAMLQSVFNAFKGKMAVSTVFFICIVAALFSVFIPTQETSFLNGAYLSGTLAKFGQAFILIVAGAVALMFKETYLSDKLFKGEVTSLYLITVMGMLTMVSSDDVITLFIGLELSSIGLYALIGYISPNRKSLEGAVKYFVLGSFAAALLLFGFGLLYASTGSIRLSEITRAISSIGNHTWVTLGGMFVIAGLSFKLALMPFHAWAPDAYEGAPTGITALMATCSKLMIIIVTLRLFAGSLEPMAAEWQPMLAFVAVMSMIFGNVMALVQSNLKRMLAYSSIAHSGYMAISICAISGHSELPFQSILFYLCGYTLTSLVAFGVIMWLENEKADQLTLSDISGLAKTHPWASFALATAMFSFAGMPPTVGFLGKFFIFNAALQDELYGLIIIGAIGSTISLYYYLRVIVKMYMTEKPEIAPVFVAKRSYLLSLVVAIALTSVLALGTLLPATVMASLKKPSSSLLFEE
ncbi:MAG: NADH-quinone oxidoreductase subunit N [Bdellovibrionota bacterium]